MISEFINGIVLMLVLIVSLLKLYENKSAQYDLSPIKTNFDGFLPINGVAYRKSFASFVISNMYSTPGCNSPINTLTFREIPSVWTLP